MKICFKCGVPKSLDDFYAHPRMADGTLNKCKQCTKKDVRDNYRANPESRRQYEKTRAKSDTRKLQQSMRKPNPVKTKARNAVRRAVASGKILVEPCVDCGAEEMLQAHHEDYTKPLDIVWLCFDCHRIRHGQDVLTSMPDDSRKIVAFKHVKSPF